MLTKRKNLYSAIHLPPKNHAHYFTAIPCDSECFDGCLPEWVDEKNRLSSWPQVLPSTEVYTILEEVHYIHSLKLLEFRNQYNYVTWSSGMIHLSALIQSDFKKWIHRAFTNWNPMIRPFKLDVEIPIHRPRYDFRPSFEKWKSWKKSLFWKENNTQHFFFFKLSMFFHRQMNQQQCPTLEMKVLMNPMPLFRSSNMADKSCTLKSSNTSM